MESRARVLREGVEFDPQRSPVKRPMGDGEAAVTSMRVVWFNSAGLTARVWGSRFTVPLAAAWLECALWHVLVKG